MIAQGSTGMDGLRRLALLVLALLARAQVIALVLALVVVVTPPSARIHGDRLQVALPLLAWACAGSTGRQAANEFFLRYLTMVAITQSAKRGLGDAPINRRPSGSLQGFPSGHMSTAVLGASALVHECLRNAPGVAAGVIVAAGLVGASRIEAGKHDIWQVLAGAILGLVCERAFRKPSAARNRILSAAAAGSVLGRGLRWLWAPFGVLWRRLRPQKAG